MSIPTEPIGSVPRPRQLIDAMQDASAGRLEPAAAAAVAEEALRDTLARFEATGSPVITDGEQTKPSFATYPIHGLENLAPDGVTIPFADGHTRRLPRLTAGPFRYRTRAATYVTAARRHTALPVKQAVISASALSLLYPADAIDGYPREQFLGDLVSKYKVMPPGVVDPSQVSTDFFAGRAAMVMLSTGALTFIREGAKFPYKVAFVPRQQRNAAPIGGGSMVIFKTLSPEQREAAWTFLTYMTSAETLGKWSRATGYFAPRKSSYDLPEMKSFIDQHPDALVALKQLEYAQPWLATYNVVAVRKALEDQVQAVLSGRQNAADAVRVAQKGADEIMKPYQEKLAQPGAM